MRRHKFIITTILLFMIIFCLSSCTQKEEELEHVEFKSNLKPMMIFVDNQLYRFGRKHTEKLDDTNSCKLTWEVDSWVDETEMPTKNNQVNFNSGTKFKFYVELSLNFIKMKKKI